MATRRSHHSLVWHASHALKSVTAGRPLIQRTGPAWAFGLIGLAAEIALAPVVLAITVLLGVATYLVLDAPWSRIRAQQRPRFVSVRILYLNVMIVAGFWLAVMFVFSAADPAVSNGVEQRLPALLDMASASDLRSLVAVKRSAMIMPVRDAVGPASTWFDVFIHGLISTLTLNFLLYALVIAHRRRRSHHRARDESRRSRRSLRYDSLVGLFVDEDSRPAG